MVDMKPKKIKARRYWKYVDGNYLFTNRLELYRGAKVESGYVLPADAASVEAMVEQMAEMIFCTDATDDRGINLFNDLSGSWQEHYRTNARAALAAIGIK